MAKEGFTAKLVVRERNLLLGAGGSVAVLLGLALLSSINTLGFAGGIYGLHVAALGALLSFLVLWKNFFPRRKELVVQADGSGLSTGGRFISRAGIESGFFQPRAARTTSRSCPSSVCLVDTQHRIVFEAEVASHARAAALLRALGLDAGNRSATFHVSSRIDRDVAVGIAVALALMTGWVALPAFVGLLMALPILLGFAPTEVVVGIDGILVKWLWSVEFIPMADVKSITPEGDHVIRIRHGLGREQVIRVAAKRQTLTDFGREQRDAIHARITEARSSWRVRSTDLVDRLGRAAPRTAMEWRRALADLRSDRSYRQLSLRDDDLWRIVEDPSAPPGARAGAAALLRPSLDQAGRARIQRAADATALPRLRLALDVVAFDAGESDDSALAAEMREEMAAPARARARATARARARARARNVLDPDDVR